jgi:hypothetical protein
MRLWVASRLALLAAPEVEAPLLPDRQENTGAIREFECVMLHSRDVFVDLPKIPVVEAISLQLRRLNESVRQHADKCTG